MECTYARTRALERAYARVSARAFSGQQPRESLGFSPRPRHRAEYRRVVLVDGKVVAGAGIFDIPVRYGQAVLRLGGVGDVVTDPDEQGKGYSRACMNDVLALLAGERFDVSLLYGIPHYYHRFGYRTAVTYSMHGFNPQDVEAHTPTSLLTQRIRRRDLAEMAALYQRTIGRYDLSVVREEIDWQYHFREGRMQDGYALWERSGELLAYVLIGRGWDDDSRMLSAMEVATSERADAYEGILALMSREAKQRFRQRVQLHIPQDGPFARYCLYKKRITWHRKTYYESGPMLRIVDFDGLFGKIAGTLSARWRQAPHNTAPESITLRCSLGQVTLVPDDGNLDVQLGGASGSVLDVPNESLTELVMGFRPANDILRDAHVTVSPPSLAILTAVFPVSAPYIPWTDHF